MNRLIDLIQHCGPHSSIEMFVHFCCFLNYLRYFFRSYFVSKSLWLWNIHVRFFYEVLTWMLGYEFYVLVCFWWYKQARAVTIPEGPCHIYIYIYIYIVFYMFFSCWFLGSWICVLFRSRTDKIQHKIQNT